MAGILELFMFGTVWYFLVTSVWVIALIWGVEKEKPIGSGIWLILYLCFLQFMAHVNFLDQILRHPIASTLWMLGYFVVGFLWSFIKWWIYVNKKAEEFTQVRFSFLKERQRWYLHHKKEKEEDEDIEFGHKSPEMRRAEECLELENITTDTRVPNQLQEDWKSFIRFKDVVPQVKDKKGKISIWIVYWPVSMIWSLVNDFVKKAIRIIVMKCRKVYDAITKGAFKKLDVPENME